MLSQYMCQAIVEHKIKPAELKFYLEHFLILKREQRPQMGKMAALGVKFLSLPSFPTPEQEKLTLTKDHQLDTLYQACKYNYIFHQLNNELNNISDKTSSHISLNHFFSSNHFKIEIQQNKLHITSIRPYQQLTILTAFQKVLFLENPAEIIVLNDNENSFEIDMDKISLEHLHPQVNRQGEEKRPGMFSEGPVIDIDDIVADMNKKLNSSDPKEKETWDVTLKAYGLK